LSHQLSFKLLYLYNTIESGITLEVVLGTDNKEQRVAAKLDTGASFCIFQREYAEALGLDVASGERISIGTATGTFIAYGH
jgi:hypothetical protein